jgi:uncharacterized membrane protein
MIKLSERRARWIVAALIAASTVGFTYLAYRKYSCFTWETPDTASIAYGFFHALQGTFFPYYGRSGCLLGEHADFILLAWFPVFKLFPSMVTLFFFQSLMISLAAWPAYLLARSVTSDPPTAIIATAGLLLFPAVVGQHVNQIHEDQFGLAFLLFTLYFFENERFSGFAIFAVLATLAKETIALNVLMFGFYALARKRHWPWIICPLVWGSSYLAVMLGWLMPQWGSWGKTVYGHMLYFGQYGNTPVEVLRHMLLNPAGTLEAMLQPDRIGYLMLLLLPLLLVGPYRSWAWLLAFPSVLINLLGTNRLLRDLTWHYSLIAGGLLWASFVLSLPNWTRFLERRFGPRNYSRILCLAALVLSVGMYRVWLWSWQYRPAENQQACVQAVAKVPLNASVLSPENMLAHFARHPAIHSFAEMRYYNIDPNQIFDYDYIVFDASYGSPDWKPQSQLFGFISKHPDYHLIYSRDNVFVFHRVGIPARVLHW